MFALFGASLYENKERKVAMHTSALERPTVTLSTLAKAMGPISPRELGVLLAGHKRPSAPRARSYQSARRQAIELLVDKKPLDETVALRTHERDALRALARMNPSVESWIRAKRPSPRGIPWTIGDIVVSMHPDVELEGARESGAAKFSFTKQPLAPGVGTIMATLMWHWRKHVLGIESTSQAQCIVFEPRLPRTHRPMRNARGIVRSAELAAKVITAIWADI
jgi:hypothetical protein